MYFSSPKSSVMTYNGRYTLLPLDPYTDVGEAMYLDKYLVNPFKQCHAAVKTGTIVVCCTFQGNKGRAGNLRSPYTLYG